MSLKSSFLFSLLCVAVTLIPRHSSAEGGKTRIDVMVVYTPAVTAYRNGHDPVHAHILNSVTLSNHAMENSGIPVYLNLVHVEETSYVESSSLATDLGRLRLTSDGFMDEVHALRTKHGADLVALMRRGAAGGVAGIAYLLSNTSGSPAFAFSVVSDASSAASLLMAHEFGHNFGAAHDRDNSSNGGILSDSYGHRFTGTKGVTYRTIMAYAPGSRVAHFSNPEVSFSGTPTGLPESHFQSADNARTLTRFGPILAGYRAEKAPGPDAIFNGRHFVTDSERDFDPGFIVANGADISGFLRLENSVFSTTYGFHLGVGPNSKASLILGNSTIESSGDHTLLAASAGSEAAVTIGAGSMINFSSGNTFDRIGHSGAATVFINEGGTLHTRHAILAENTGSSGVVSLSGNNALWNHNSWYVDIGRRGYGEVNVLNGALVSNVQRLHVGGSLMDQEERTGIGILNVSGEGSRVMFAARSSLPFLAIGRQGQGTVNVTDGGELTLRTTSSSTGYIQLAEMPGDVGNLNVTSGGRVSTPTFLRAGIRAATREEPGPLGKIRVTGSESLLVVSGYVQLALAGRANLIIEEGGRMTSGSNFYLSRSTGQSSAFISGTGSLLAISDRLHLSANPTRDPSGGTSFLKVEEGGRVTVLNDVVLRSGSVIELHPGGVLETNQTVDLGAGANLLLAGGKLTLGHNFNLSNKGFQWQEGIIETKSSLTGVASIPSNSSLILTGPAASSHNESGQAITLNSNSTIRGTGLIGTEVNLGVDGSGSVSGDLDPDSLTLEDGVSGNGSLDTLTVGGLIVPGNGAGLIEMKQVRFASGAILKLEVTGPGEHNVIVFDRETDFTNLTVEIRFLNLLPSAKESFRLFDYSGDGSPAFNFAEVQTPDGWLLSGGRLVSEEVPATFASWANMYQLAGDDALPGADPAGDGFTNLEEFAFGTDPTSFTATLARISREGDDLIFHWNRSVVAGIDYVIEESENLLGWSPVADAKPIVMAMVDPFPPAGYERVEWVAKSADSSTRSFYRIRAEIDPSLLP